MHINMNFLAGVSLQIYVSIIVSLNMLSDGMSIGWNSEKINELTTINNNNNGINITASTLEESSLVGTLGLYSVFIAIPVSIYSTNNIGRKWTIMCGASIGILSWTIRIITEIIEYIYVSTFLKGFAAFVSYSSTQIYIAEIADTKIRGLLGSCVPILMNLGILLSYVLIKYIQLKYLSLLGAVFGGISLIGLYFAPKTPYFYFIKNKPKEAETSLRKLRNSIDISKELNEIQTIVEKDILETENKYSNFLTKQNMKITMIVSSAHMFQQFSGIDAILLFLQVILKSSDIQFFSSDDSSIIFGICKLISCATALVLIDFVGRKPLMLISCFCTSVSLASLGVYFYLQDILNMDLSSVSWLPLILLLLYILSYNIGLGSVTFVLASEMFPTKFKALGSAIASVVYATSMLIVTEIVAWLKDNYGFHLAFWWLSINTFIGFIFDICFLTETKGKTFKQILDEI